MQVTSFAWIDDASKERIAVIVADKYCRTILQHIVNQPKSPIEISHTAKIPISTVYRKLHVMCNLKLLKIFGEISDDGKKYFYYKSKVKEISISLRWKFRSKTCCKRFSYLKVRPGKCFLLLYSNCQV